MKTKRGGDQESEISKNWWCAWFKQYILPTPADTHLKTFSQLAPVYFDVWNTRSSIYCQTLSLESCQDNYFDLSLLDKVWIRIIVSLSNSLDSSSSHPPPSHLLLRWFWILNGPGYNDNGHLATISLTSTIIERRSISRIDIMCSKFE